MERVVSSPVEIKKSRVRISQFDFETVLAFSNPISVNGFKMGLRTLGDFHYRVGFTNMDYPNPMTQKLTFGRQYETGDGTFIFRGISISSGTQKYLFLEFNLKTPG